MSLATLASEAKKFGISNLMKSTFVSIETRGKLIEAAVIDGFQNTPASKYHEGVDVSLLRYHSDYLSIPDGYYKFSIQSIKPIRRVGRHVAISKLSDKNNKCIHCSHHFFDVTSVELPRVQGRRVVIQINNFEEGKKDKHIYSEHLEWTIQYCCKNGTCGTCIGRGCPKQK